MPPAIFAMFIPANAIIGPVPVLAAALFIASACAVVRVAAAIVGSLKTALLCSSLIICSSSSDAVTELMPNDTIARPLNSDHFLESTSLSASAISIVCPGSAL